MTVQVKVTGQTPQVDQIKMMLMLPTKKTAKNVLQHGRKSIARTALGVSSWRFMNITTKCLRIAICIRLINLP